MALSAAVIVASCGKLEDRINSLEQRISELEDTRIPSIDEQMTSIQKTIGELEKTDAGLREYITALEEKQTALEAELGKTNAALTEAQKTLREEMAADKTELSGVVDAAKADVIAQLEAYKTLMNGELETLNGTIAELKAKDEELQKNAEELRGYVDSENGKVRDWADATFATIEQQNKLAETVAGIKTQFETLNSYTMNMDVRLTNRAEELSKSLSSLDESTRQQIGSLTEKLGSDISALRSELTDAYTKLVATEITRLETSMKSWVSEQLAGYYTVEQTDAKLEAMRTELTGRMDSDKAYLTTLITNLETATNRKISANAGLITGLRGDLTSLSQSVAENAGKIADDAILISQNTADISKNSSAIAANTKDLAAVKKLAEENQKLIAENGERLGEMERLHSAMKDSGVEDCVETVLQNSKDIASNASLIAKNAESIRSNAAAIAQNASDIQALQTRLDATRTEIVEAYTAAIAKAIGEHDGTVTAKIASEVAKVEEKIAGLKTEVESVKSRVAALEDRVSRLEEIVGQITSISYIPRYADGAERVEYTRDALDIIPGDVTLRFDVHPASAASEIAANWESVLSARAVYTLTKAGAGDFVDLKVKGAAAENGVLSVTVSAEGLNKDFIVNNTSSSVVVKVTSETKNVISDYVKLTPSGEELKFVQYLLNNFDTDGDVGVELAEVENAKDVNISGMNITTLDGVVDKMTSLEKLDCSKNSLTSLNLECNPKLKILFCENNELQSLDLTNNENLCAIDYSGNKPNISVIHNGLLVAGMRWSLVNVGAYSSTGCGQKYNFDDIKEKTICPDGWRLPTAYELEKVSENYKVEQFYGTYGFWLSGDSVFSESGNAVFFPITNIGENSWGKKSASSMSARYGSTSYKYLDDGYRLKLDISTFNGFWESVSVEDNGTNDDRTIRCVKDE